MLSRSFNLTAYNKIKSFKKVVEVDPDKSISIRSFLIGAISSKCFISKKCFGV